MNKRDTKGYSLWQNGRKKYIGITNNPDRREKEHQANHPDANLRPDTGPRTPESARVWEQESLETYRRNHGGKLPPWNGQG